MTTARSFFGELWETLTGRMPYQDRECAMCEQPFDQTEHIGLHPVGTPHVPDRTPESSAALSERILRDRTGLMQRAEPTAEEKANEAAQMANYAQAAAERYRAMANIQHCILHGYAAGYHRSCVINTGPYCNEPVTQGQIDEGDAHPIDERGVNDGQYEHDWCVQPEENDGQR